ncbi:Spo0E family sporulation regulatory protein-aspartic acid phosphatase [Ectobacillus sp. sgz5001026]|uniref:Spo0E family sporulation regulatory protein-aspartic acid phosphatase n=1 Tax=Ectobacillus sp. sgz5001026 TaxID=3242473 RepID=UPI0036D3C711
MFMARKKNVMDKLLLEIKVKQREMIEIGLRTGFNSPETLTVSQELDVYIVKYQRLKAQEKEHLFTKIRKYVSGSDKNILYKSTLQLVFISLLR